MTYHVLMPTQCQKPCLTYTTKISSQKIKYFFLTNFFLPLGRVSLKGLVINCLEGDPEKGLVGGCWRAGE